MTTPVFRSQVPFFHAADVAITASFYQKLGFRVANSVAAPDGALQWIWLDCAGTSIMFARASEPFLAAQQAALLYLYTDDVAVMRAHLLNQGVDASEITTPFWAPRGEFRVTDPDGWCLMITHTR